jgi:hypothetical protein
VTALPRWRARGEFALLAEVTVDLPDWIPRVVRDLVPIISADLQRQGATFEASQLLHRLVFDPRMKNVWNELLRRKRQDYERTEAFVHPASRTSWTLKAASERRRAAELRKFGGSKNEAEADRLELLAALAEVADVEMLFPWYPGRPELPQQDLAVAYFFSQTFALAQQSPRPVPMPEARKARRPYLDIATQLRADHFWGASFAYEALADAAAPPPGSPLLVKRRRRSDERMQGFVIALAATTKQVFEAPLCGTVATAANVALGRDDLTAETVRKMLPRALRP